MSTTPDETYDPYDQEPLPEGEEEPPPFVHTMAIVRWTMFGAMTLFALIMVLGAFGLTPWSTGTAAAVMYHCPMHPTYISNQPGECPICGMTLVPINSEGQEINKPDTTHAEQAAAAVTKARPGQYTCPMDPDVISDKPGRCPKCGMKLVLVPPDTAGSTHAMGDSSPGNSNQTAPVTDHSTDKMAGMGSAPVPGLVPVTIEPERLQLIGIRTARVERRPASGTIRLVGFVTPDETHIANIQVRVSGWVSQLFVDETGQYVKAGDLLLSVYSQDLYQAEQDFMVARDAAAKPGDSALTSMRHELLDAARQRLRLLGLPKDEIAKLDKSDLPSPELPLRSPFSGYVLEKSVNQGQYISPQQNLFSIADLDTVWVLADVYEQDLPYVHLGQTVRMHLTALPGEEFVGKVGFIYPTISEKTRTLKVRLEFPNPSLRMRPGMYAEVEVDRGGAPMLAVPIDAVMDGGETQYAFVVHDHTHFEPRLVKLGRTTDDWAEILSGLSEGEEVVTGANFLIDSESRLKAAVAGMEGTESNTNAEHSH